MATISDRFVLRNSPICSHKGQRFLRVPFGLCHGRALAPSEVAPGKACGCVCPGCLAPLTARAQSSRRQRPHFAHLKGSGCTSGPESGIHLRAKQVILDTKKLLLPGWNGDLVEMPNPPIARDIAGKVHRGREVNFPARITMLAHAEPEKVLDNCKPDIYARDEGGELLIEIRVTHAVDDQKTIRVKAAGQRMVEIDLSGMGRAVPHDIERFDRQVLFSPEIRTWINAPGAEAEWRASSDELLREVERVNTTILQERARLSAEVESQQKQALREEALRQRRREHVRTTERRRHAADLKCLPQLVEPSRVAILRMELQKAAEPRLDELLEDSIPAVRSACLRAHPDAWIYGVDPALWQLLAFRHFIDGTAPGHRFNQRAVARWVLQTFPTERRLYRLFATQYGKRADAKRAGYPKRALNYWVFTDLENSLIPNFYDPINDFLSRLVDAQLIRRLEEPIGEMEILPNPASGLHPVAYPANKGALLNQEPA